MKKLTYAMIMNEELKVKEEDLEIVIQHIDDNNELTYDELNRIYNETGTYIADLISITSKKIVLENLKGLIGTEIDTNEIIIAFEDYEENGETSVYVGESHNNSYDAIAYINTSGSTQFLFTLDKNNIITDVWEA